MEVEVFARFGGRLEESTRDQLRRGSRARELLKQPPASPIPLGEQVALLLALQMGLFDMVEAEQVAQIAKRYRALLARQHPSTIRALSVGHLPSESEHEALKEAFLSLVPGQEHREP
jgi:F-type H+-transporting ATPase subunit alpha